MTIKELIISEIKKKGKINTEEFINLCMYGENGYYIQKKPIGKKNDFITAPEISQMYGEILTIFLINYWEEKIKTKSQELYISIAEPESKKIIKFSIHNNTTLWRAQTLFSKDPITIDDVQMVFKGGKASA